MIHGKGEKVLVGSAALIGGILGGLCLGAVHLNATARATSTQVAPRTKTTEFSASRASATGIGIEHGLVEAATQTYAAQTNSDTVTPSAAKTAGSEPLLHLTPREVLALAQRCAPAAPASVLASIAKVESGDAPWLIGQNGKIHRVFRSGSRQDAETLATRLIGSGRSVDLGLAQINSRNLGWLRLSPADALDPCQNLAAAAKIMDRGYQAALKLSPPDRPLMQTAFSLYNTGDADIGMINGYVAKVEAARRE